jgi:hypothetical protein
MTFDEAIARANELIDKALALQDIGHYERADKLLDEAATWTEEAEALL